VRQYPTWGAKVKNGRKVYLTIVAKKREMVPMPNVVDLSIRRAVDVLQYGHLKVKNIEFVNDIALNAVLEQKIRGIHIPPDSLLQSGSEIVLVVGNGYIKEGSSVPFIIGKTYQDACDIILKSSFNIGYVDTLNYEKDVMLRVYKQNPHADPHHSVLRPLGSKISFTLIPNRVVDFDSLVKFHQTPDSLKYDSLMNIEEPIDF